jgi:hypothetical protein
MEPFCEYRLCLSEHGGHARVGVMENKAAKRHTAMIVMSSDHAGVNRELHRLEKELNAVIGLVVNARDIRDYLNALRAASARWLDSNWHG